MYRQSKQPTPTVFEYSVSAWTSRNPWNPSLIRRLPWLGFSALLGALVGTASSVAVLVASNGKPASEWSIQPTVYLAASSTITNISLYLSFSEGVKVAWWRRATKENTKIADLHRHWSFCNSFWVAFTSGKHFNLVALASVLITLSPINGPLVQLATRLTVRRFSQPSNLGIAIAQSLPDGYTGYLSGQETPALLTTAFTPTAQAFDRKTAINVNNTGCQGECMATVRGAGFAVNCSTSTTPFSLTPSSPGTEQVSNTSRAALTYETLVFGSYLSWEASEPGTLHLGVQFKDQQACDGKLRNRNCTFRAAVVDYPVIVSGDKNSIELAPESPIFDRVIHNVTLNTTTAPMTTLGGLYKTLSDTYDSEAKLRFLGANGYGLTTTGGMPNQYAVLDMSSQAPCADCTLSFRDPSDDILAAIRDLIFRTAIAAADSSDTQQVTAQETRTLPIYELRYLYLLCAVICTAVGWLAVIPLFFNWWHVGRTVSMSPIETAKAFGASQLRSSDSNADAGKLLEEIGDRPIQYGATTVSGVEYRLEMTEPEDVRVPRAGERFAG